MKVDITGEVNRNGICEHSKEYKNWIRNIINIWRRNITQLSPEEKEKNKQVYKKRESSLKRDDGQRLLSNADD